MKNKHPKKSPIKTPPLKRAGGSHLYQFHAKVVMWLLYAVVLPLALLLGYWIRGIISRFPVLEGRITLLSFVLLIAIIIFAFFFIRRVDKKFADILLGREGELAVAEELAKLGRRDNDGRLLWREFHDVELPEGGNADHVLVCEMGIYCLETKTLRKRGELDTLVFDGDKVGFKNGGALTKPDPIPQARKNAAQLSNFLAANGVFASAGENKIFVKPVVVFPGWAVEWTPDGKPEQAKILVCGEKGLGRIEEKRQAMPENYLIPPDKIAAIGDILERANRSA